MGRRRGGDKIHNRKKELEKKDFKRKIDDRMTVADVIIACEDSVSSPAYFKKIVERLIKERKITQDSFVIAKHKHTNPTGVLEDLTKYIDENGKTYKDFMHKWIVIDRDEERINGGGHTAEDFNNAIQEANNEKIKVAYCNDSFELWYLLHFNYRHTSILRDEIIKEVIKLLKKEEPYKFAKLNKDNIKDENYTKMIFETLFLRQQTAINNAKKLLRSYAENHNPEQDNPSTKVHELVEILNSLSGLTE